LLITTALSGHRLNVSGVALSPGKRVMAETSVSLLERLCDQPDDATWRRLVDLYGPLLRSWLGRYHLQPADVDDLVQEVLAVVVRELPQFQHNRRPGAFRRWLRTILVNRLRPFWRARQSRPEAGDDERALEELADPDSGLSRLWDQEHDRHVLRRLLELIREEFTLPTWEAFLRVTLQGQDEEAVAAELGLSVHAVFVAKSRVLCRLRREAKGLLD
jgi:RNA polymerase sigma factor (sigma-70 family)